MISVIKNESHMLSIPHCISDLHIQFTKKISRTMRCVHLAVLVCLIFSIQGQTVINFEEDIDFSDGQMIVLADDISIPKIKSGYTLWLPDSEVIEGLIVFMHAGRDTINRNLIIDYALERDLAVMYVTTENRFEFFFDNKKMQQIENYIHSALHTNQINKENILYCGMSLAGTRALKLAKFGLGEDSELKLVPRAIAICDAPLDMIRFHKECVKAHKLQFHSAAANEGKWVSSYLTKNLGFPENHLKKYIKYSPYCYIAENGGNARFFKNIAVRAYTEPDVNWWIANRRKDYYGMNSVDMAGLVNELRISGNDNAELITTSNKGHHPDGTRHPHSWSIVNEKELVDWFLGLLAEEKL